MTTNTAPLLPSGADARITALLDDGLTRYTRRQNKRGRMIAAAAGAAVVLGAGSLAWVTLAPHTQQTRSAYCYSADSVDSRYTQVGLPDEQTGPNGASQVPTPADRAASAVDMCSSAWTAGILGDSTGVPPLVVCVRPDNVPAVFPRKPSDTRSDAAFCSALDLALER
ncbi:hypothetical protein [Leifsonia sp. TF02-11]|uniref:hypothetical protein n=1 Tax=Leifsonia sp. TF02-11 TaxID=2815212 RepID=UPI001AA19DB5|nr:hypothetical protein [Leifsonia sp. TF02-11]MBO1741215.1 hypothetical protein [Leifsonia sp. TF02-11]